MTYQQKETFCAGYQAISPAVMGSRETKAELTSWCYQRGSSWWESDRRRGDRLPHREELEVLREKVAANETVVGLHSREVHVSIFKGERPSR